jgi:hypothetical protein
MGVSFDRTTVPGTMPVFWRGECKVLPGGFTPKQTFVTGDIIPRGAPVQADFENMQVGIVKLAYVLAGGTTTAPRVTKGSLLKVGDVVMKIGKNDVSPSVSAINKDNAAYDVITLSAEISGLTAGDFLQECSAYVAAVDEVSEVKGVYTLTIGTNAADGDKISINGTEYEFVTTPAEGKITIGETAALSAAALEAVVDDNAALLAVFDIATTGATITFTQKVGGTGAIPVIVVTQATEGTLAASIATTTPGVAAVAAAAAVVAAVLYTPDAIVEKTLEYNTNRFNDLSIGYETCVLKAVAYPLPASYLDGYSLKNNHSIKYIKQ